MARSETEGQRYGHEPVSAFLPYPCCFSLLITTSSSSVDHPHGGGRGKSKGNKHPRTPQGLKTKGRRTRRPVSCSLHYPLQAFSLTTTHVDRVQEATQWSFDKDLAVQRSELESRDTQGSFRCTCRSLYALSIANFAQNSLLPGLRSASSGSCRLKTDERGYNIAQWIKSFVGVS